MATSETAKLIAELALKDKLTPEVTKALVSLDKLDRGVNRTSKSLGRMGKGAGQVGLGLAKVVAFGAGAAVVALGAGTKAAIDFESAFAGVRKTVSGAELEAAGLSFDKLKKQFLDLSTVIPVTASDLASIGEAAGALGIRAQDITKFSETVAKLGVTTNLTTDQAAQDLGKIGTILGLKGKGFEEFGDILVNLGNKGASTETDIIEVTKRFAAAGKSAGLSTPQILAFASAIASAGVEPEAAGSSLSRLFGNIIKETALATDKGKAFAKVSGKSFKDFAKIVKTDTNGAMLLFLKHLKTLGKFDQAKALKAVGITNVRDINAIRLLAQTYDQNLIPALENAANSAGALDRESTVRFDTIKSKFALLKNAFIKGGIEMGDGFLPALGRLTTKITAWVNANSSKLQGVGRDIGKALDDIDWKEVERGALKVRDAASLILEVVKAIPTEVKLGGLAFLGLDKAAGGLLSKGLGNILGGSLELVFKQFVGRGASPANPLWVQSVGGIGGPGGPGAAGGLGTVGKVVAGGIIVGGVALSLESIQQLADANAAAAKQGLTPAEIAAMRYYQASTADQAFMAKHIGGIPSKADWESALNKLGQPVAGGGGDRKPSVTVDARDRQLDAAAFRPTNQLLSQIWRQGRSQRDTLRAEHIKGAAVPDLGTVGPKLDKVSASTDKVGTKVEGVRGAIFGGFDRSTTAVETMKGLLGTRLEGTTAAERATAHAVSVAGISAALASQRAGDRVAAATHGTTRAIDRKDLSVDVFTRTSVSTSVSIRDQARTIVRNSRINSTSRTIL